MNDEEKCIHGSPLSKDCKTCWRLSQPITTYEIKNGEVYRHKTQLYPVRLQKFCKKHLSIWGQGSWWCLYAIWMDRLELCEEEYLEVQ